MAGVVGGITRLFQPTVGVLAAEKTCTGLNPWYFLVGLHLVSVFFAYGPWDTIKSDLVCHWPSGTEDEKTFCNALCYNQRFPVAISSAWALHLLVILIVVALMKFVFVTVKKKDSSGKDVEAAVEPMPELGSSAECEWDNPADRNKFGGWRYAVYISCIVMILAATSIFIFVLLGYQLPAVLQKTFICTPDNAACPASVQCAFTGRADKRAILWAMACCSVATISLCIGYLATHACLACGFCGGPDGTKEVGGGHRSREIEGGGHRFLGDLHSCQRCGRGAGGPGYQGDDRMGMARCRCWLEGANCYCGQEYSGGRKVTCGCSDDRHSPFQGSDIGQSLNSMASKEETEGKLLRGDTEVAGEKTDWRAHEGRMLTEEPLRTGAKRGQGSPGGGGGGRGRGKAVKNVAKYQVCGKQRM